MLSLPFVAQTPDNLNRPAVIAPFAPRSIDEARGVATWAQHARVAGADAIEWRVDALADTTGLLTPEDELAEEALVAQRLILDQDELPVLMTLRSSVEGGRADVDGSDYRMIVSALMDGAQHLERIDGPDAKRVAVDIEANSTPADELIYKAKQLGIPTVVSFHDFGQTPEVNDLLSKFRSIVDRGADVAKIAVMPKDPGDVARMIYACATCAEIAEVPIIGISMGTLGRSTRIFGGDFGSAATFAPIGGAETAPGQIPVERLRAVWEEMS